jgi:DNA-binding NarL/FixJ family response regulator
MNSLSPTTVNGQKTVSPPRPARSNGVSSSCVSGNDQKHPIKLAIVDDNEDERSLMTRDVDQSLDLERVGSYRSGLAALAGITSSACEVVLMDVRMPNMSGFECTRRLKDVRPDLIILMISGFDDPETAAQARKAGADAYLTKPFPLGRFFEALPVCLRSRTKERPEPLPTASSVSSASDQCAGSAIQHQRGSAEQDQGLLTVEPAVHKALLRMVIALEENFHAREDLLQEALLYFWSTERQCPGRPLSWYVQSVKFHLQNLRTSGRSLDSSKRRRAQAAFADNCDGWDERRESFELDEGIMSAVHAHDIFSVLSDRLKPTDQLILRAMLEGLCISEITHALHVPRGFVERHRLEIAKQAVKLGITPV